MLFTDTENIIICGRGEEMNMLLNRQVDVLYRRSVSSQVEVRR